MIEIIRGLPDNVLGVVVKGRVTRLDCTEILQPAVERALQWHHRLRLYYEIRSRYPGAAWEEVTLGAERALVWERIALVTDVAWIRHTIQAVRLLIPSEIRVFATTQIPEGLVWAVGAPVRRGRVPPVPGLGASRDGRAFRPPLQYLHHAP